MENNNINNNEEITPILISENLDMKISDYALIVGLEGVTNEQTWREFIRESEEEFELKSEMIDIMTESDLVLYIDFLDELWMK